VDPVTGAVLADGEIGELVFTSLTKEALPVIRYRTGESDEVVAANSAFDATDGQGDGAHRRHVPQRRIKSYIGITVSVSVCNPGAIERSVGKAKRVFDRRDRGLPPVAV
jgi:phenylacetate-coenzyme A ligase PaaK-like adenylate-forming protein